MIEIIKYNSENKILWDEFVENSKNGIKYESVIKSIEKEIDLDYGV